MTHHRDGRQTVLLDLTDTQDYIAVVHALEEYASAQDWEAEKEQERIDYNKLPESENGAEQHREMASRARRLAEDIERQLEGNSHNTDMKN